MPRELPDTLFSRAASSTLAVRVARSARSRCAVQSLLCAPVAQLDRAPAFFFTRGASPLELPHTLSREPLRRLAPFAWLAPLAHVCAVQSLRCAPVAQLIEHRPASSLEGRRPSNSPTRSLAS